jgi:hypothetical protein
VKRRRGGGWFPVVVGWRGPVGRLQVTKQAAAPGEGEGHGSELAQELVPLVEGQAFLGVGDLSKEIRQAL